MKQDHQQSPPTNENSCDDDESPMSSDTRGFNGKSQTDRRLDLKEKDEEIKSLEPAELRIKRRLRMSKDADPADVRLKLRSSTSNTNHAKELRKLNDLHQHRLQRSRIVGGLESDYPVELTQTVRLPPGPSHIVKPSNVHAVIVGIDGYPGYPLHGCVSDARLMEKYLIEVLGVPNNHIRLLLGSEEHTSPNDQMNPSRANIIGALLGLANNAEIKDGDIIIIYFAGHGSSYSSPDDDAESVIVETLCPIDRNTVVNNKPIPDISDREFNTILSLISREKGHRITVILDCCHGGGASRDVPESGARIAPMGNATLDDMFLTGEKNLKNYPGYRSILSKTWCPDMDSHVVLAACKDYQFAKEKKVEGKDGGHIGVFTDKLVRVLRSGYITEDTTYVDLIVALGSSVYQTPGVHGKNKKTSVWHQERCSRRALIMGKLHRAFSVCFC